MLLTRMRLLSHRYGCLNGVRYLNTREEDQVLPTSTATTTTRRKKKKIQHHATAMTIVMLGSGGSNSFRNGRKQPCIAVNLPYGGMYINSIRIHAYPSTPPPPPQREPGSSTRERRL